MHAGEITRTVGSYVDAFTPGPAWAEMPDWPPDVFTVANLVLDHTEGYRFVVAPPPGRQWPPTADWNERVVAAAREWRDAVPQAVAPDVVRRSWDRVTRGRETPLAQVSKGTAWELCAALLTLHAVADEACAGLAADAWRPTAGSNRARTSFEARAWSMLESRGSLSHFSPSRVRIVPKTQFAARGITIRSLSRYLALCYESVEVRWRCVEPLAPVPRDLHLMLLPWPRSVSAQDFRPASNPLGNMDTSRFGFFEFAPRRILPVDRVHALLAAGRRAVGAVDALVLPEAVMAPAEVSDLEATLTESGAGLLVTGVRQPATGSAFGRNYLHFGVRTRIGWERYEQDKHHRWCLDEGQIGQYRLTRVLDPGKQWWEAIDIPARTLHVVDIAGTTVAPLVCEDLARLDEVADLVRRIGPALVIALLLDGPQLTTRWPSRYACVLGDEPGSAVLTLTALGMATRSRPPGMRASRAVALWNDPTNGLREIELGRGAEAILLTVSVGTKTAWTADGRCHRNVPTLVLKDVHQLRASPDHVAVGQG